MSPFRDIKDVAGPEVWLVRKRPIKSSPRGPPRLIEADPHLIAFRIVSHGICR